MAGTPVPVWIRQRPVVVIVSAAWHVEQQVTPAGVRVTSCALVIAPDEVERFAAEPGLDPAEDRCAVCWEHLEMDGRSEASPLDEGKPRRDRGQRARAGARTG